MANIEVTVAGRKYLVACRDGEEDHLRSVAALVDRRARDAEAALGNLGEARQLLFTALMLADDIKELQKGNVPALPPEPDEETIAAVEGLAERLEAMAVRAEIRAGLREA